MTLQEEEQVLQFHYAYLEQACGATLDQISALNWDQNEFFNQFGGAVCLVPGGYSKVMKELAKDIDIRLNTQVDTTSEPPYNTCHYQLNSNITWLGTGSRS